MCYIILKKSKKWKKIKKLMIIMRDKRAEIEKQRKKEIAITETRKKTETKNKPYSPDIHEISPKRCQMFMDGMIWKKNEKFWEWKEEW